MMRDCETRQFANLGVALLLLGLGSCQQDRIKAPYRGQLDLMPLVDYPQIAVQGGLHEALWFGQPDVDLATDVSPMSVRVPVRSIHDRYGLNIQYRFDFYDQNMRPLSNAGWRFTHLRPRVGETLEANALHINATKFRLEVRSTP